MEKIKFNDNWRVWKDLDPFELIFRVPDDAVTVDLPYDAMFHEEQKEGTANGGYTGNIDGAEYKYYKEFFVDEVDRGKRMLLQFEGIYHNALVFVNQSKVGECPYGYTDFSVEITDYIKYGQKNSILVLVKCGTKSSRWYSGAGSHDIQNGILELDDPNFKLKRKRLERANAFYRINHVSWWERELPTKEEMEEGRRNLALVGNKVDYVITHSPCTSLMKQMNGGCGLYHSDRLTDYLQEMKESIEYKHWIFGHMHINENYPWERSTCIYEQIVRIL